MSFEDDMIEAGYSDEEEYLESLMDEYLDQEFQDDKDEDEVILSDSNESDKKPYYIFEEDEKYGVKSSSNEDILIPCIYDYIYDCEDHFECEYTFSSSFPSYYTGEINLYGFFYFVHNETLYEFPEQYDMVSQICDDSYIIIKNHKMGILKWNFNDGSCMEILPLDHSFIKFLGVVNFNNIVYCLKDDKRFLFNNDTYSILSLADYRLPRTDGVYLYLQKDMVWYIFNEFFDKVSSDAYEVCPNFIRGVSIIKIDGKFGFMNTDFEILVRPIYDQISDIQKNFSCNYIIPDEDHPFLIVHLPEDYHYHQFHNSSDNLLLALSNGKYSILDLCGNPIFPQQVDAIRIFDLKKDLKYKTILTIRQGGRWGAIDSTGKQILDVKYVTILKFQNDLLKVELNGSYAVCSSTGQFLTGFWYDSMICLKSYPSLKPTFNKSGEIIAYNSSHIISFPIKSCRYAEGIDQPVTKAFRAIVCNSKGKWGVVDENFVETLPVIYDYIYLTYDKIVVTKLKRFYTCFDLDGKQLCPIFSKKISISIGSRVPYITSEKSGKDIFIRGKGVRIFNSDYTNIEDLYLWEEKKLCFVKVDQHWGVINSKNEMVLSTIYDDFIIQRKNLILVKKGKAWGAFNENLQMLIPLEYDEIKPLDCDSYAFCRNGKWGALNENNPVKIPLLYDEIRSYACGLYAVRQNGKWGFVNKKAEIQIPIIYDEVGEFISFSESWFATFIDYQRTLEAFMPKSLILNDYLIVDSYQGEKHIEDLDLNDSLDDDCMELYSLDDVGDLSDDAFDRPPFGDFCFGEEDDRFRTSPRKDLKSYNKRMPYQPTIFSRFDCVEDHSFSENYKTYLQSIKDSNDEILSLARVRIGNKWGIITPKGNFLFPARYDNITYNSKDYCFETNIFPKPLGFKSVKLNFKGDVWVDFGYYVNMRYAKLSKQYIAAKLSPYNNVFYVMSKNHKIGIVDSDLNVLVPCRYVNLHFKSQHKVCASTKKGKVIIDL